MGKWNSFTNWQGGILKKYVVFCLPLPHEVSNCSLTVYNVRHCYHSFVPCSFDTSSQCWKRFCCWWIRCTSLFLVLSLVSVRFLVSYDFYILENVKISGDCLALLNYVRKSNKYRFDCEGKVDHALRLLFVIE